MKCLATAFVFFLLVSIVSAQELNTALREELLAMEKADQEARKKCTDGTADEQINCLEKIDRTIDTPNTKRLEEIFKKYGFPTVKLVGKDGFQAFLLLFQHSTSDRLREKSLKPIEKAFKRKGITPL